MEETKVKGTKVSKKEARRRRNMRNTVIMAGLSVALLGGATYAWFTLSETARINNLSLTVGEASGLQIANEKADKSGADTYGFELTLGDIQNVVLMPATSEELGTIKAPAYTDGKVTGLNDVAATGDYIYSTFEDAANKASGTTVYYLEKTFYLKTEQGTADDLFNVVLEPGTNLPGTAYLTGTDPGAAAGTYMLTKNGTGDPVASAAIRISFENQTATSAAGGVYEPNSDAEGEGTGADDTRTAAPITDTVKQYLTGSFDETTAGTASDTLFQISGNTDNKIVMKVWLEGTDEQCVNEVAVDNLIGALKFKLAN